MTTEYDPTEMTEEEIDEVADEVERQQARKRTKYGGLIEADDE